MFTWDLEEGIAFCLEMHARAEAEASARAEAEASKKVAKRALGGAAQGARTARKASKKVAQGALGGAAQGAHTLPQATLSVAERGLGGAALRVQQPPEMIDSQGMIHLPASVLKTMKGLEFLEDSLFDGKKLRQMAEGRTDAKGTNILGYVAVADGGAAALFTDPSTARQWSKNKNLVNSVIAPSLTYIPSGHPNVSLIFCLIFF